jgi:trk system potassium uptake protein TrkH
LGILYVVLGGLMAGIAFFDVLDWIYSDTPRPLMPSLQALLGGALTAAAAGAGLFWAFGRRSRDTFFGRREALLLVALGWLGGAALAAVPFWVWGTWTSLAVEPHPFASYISCYFEAMSGLTTTGSTVLAEVEPVPRSLLLWRSLTHWIGGIGIVVLFVAVYSSLGVGGRKLFQFESSGRSGYDVMPQIRQTARLLWLVYLGMTVAEVLLLWAFGLNLFDAVCETFGTVASGGFSTRTASIGGYRSPAIEAVATLFMVLAGVNYGLFLLIAHGRWRQAIRDPELRAYLLLMLVGFGIIGATLLASRGPIVTSTGESVAATVPAVVRYAGFQTASLHSSTGFVTADYDRWPFLAKAVILFLMFAGPCAGSTGGGLKVMRLLVVGRLLLQQVERIFRPHVVRVVKVAGASIEPQTRLDVMLFIFTFIGLVVAGSVLLMVFEPAGTMDYQTAFSACAATINTTGPGFGKVGAVMNYGWLSPASKIVLSLLMVLGRLEIYAILVLFVPSYWRRE